MAKLTPQFARAVVALHMGDCPQSAKEALDFLERKAGAWDKVVRAIVKSDDAGAFIDTVMRIYDKIEASHE